MKGPVSEPNMFEPEVEAKGVEAILAALTEDETKYLADENMPLRHFRAEKVSVSVHSTRILAGESMYNITSDSYSCLVNYRGMSTMPFEKSRTL